MREPRRWLDASRPTPEARLLRAVADEPLPAGALERAGKRFGVSAALVGASSAAVAQAAVASSAAMGAKAGASAVVGGTTLVASAAKSIVVGVGVAAAITGAAHWTATSRKATSAASSMSVGVAGTRIVPSLAGGTRSARSSAPEPPVAPPAQSAVSQAALREQSVSETPPTDTDLGVARAQSALPALARFDDASVIPDSLGSELETFATSRAPTDARRQPEDTALAREVRLLDNVRLALRQGNARLALERLEQGKQQGLIRLMGLEASLLRVEALAMAGRSTEAAALARRLLAQGVSPSQKKVLEGWLVSPQE